MALEVRQFGDPILKSRATPVKEFDEALQHLADAMLVTMREYEGVGLAGNQVGRLKRILVAATEEEEFVIVNPELTLSTDETAVELEGCLSIPGIHVEVERPSAITLTGQDAQGTALRVEASGLLARIFQHELDHLNGVTILDRTDRESRKEAMRLLREHLLANKG
jgi:peptide deformylase